MTSQSIPKGPAADQLRNAINWQASLPGYVFSERRLQGFFIVDSGIFDTRSFLEFMLGENFKKTVRRYLFLFDCKSSLSEICFFQYRMPMK